MLNYDKSNKDSTVLTKEQIDVLTESHKKFREYIDLANKLRKTYKGKDINYFEQFFLKATKDI